MRLSFVVRKVISLFLQFQEYIESRYRLYQ